MNNSQVAHLWANQSRDSARGSNMFFDGRDIYSYGRHFKIATIVERKGKGRAVLFTTRSYSSSTGKHKNHVSGALRGLNMPVFYVPELDAHAHGLTADRHARNRESYKADIASVLQSAARARSHAAFYVERAEGLTADANEYAAFFNLAWRLKAPNAGAEGMAKIRETVKKHAARAAARTRKAQKELTAKYEKAAAEFRAGADLTTLMRDYRGVRGVNGGSLLRIQGDNVQTSRGAEVPIADARRACMFVATIRARGETWQRNGERFPVGDFQLDRVSAEGDVNAGCHFIEWSEVVHLSMLLKAAEGAA